MATEDKQIRLTTSDGKTYILRDDGYRVYAKLEGESFEERVFEYKHSFHEDANRIVEALLLKATR